MQEKNDKQITYLVDDEIQQTEEKMLTAKQILERAGFKPSDYYLVQLLGYEKKSYKDHLNDEIHMHSNMKFVAIFIGETPVSERN